MEILDVNFLKNVKNIKILQKEFISAIFLWEIFGFS
jgi:hypothetical protein